MTSPSFSQGVRTLDIDAVIVGGGVQGLWLLADLLDKGYHAVLLERVRPGFGQTGHAHVFLHEGHIFASMLREPADDIVVRIASVQQANRLWQAALAPGGRLASVSPIRSDFYVGWQTPNSAKDFQALCRRANIRCDDVGTPSEFGDMRLTQRFFRSDGVCIDSKQLLETLMSHGGLGARVGQCKKARVESYGAGGVRLVIERATEAPLGIRASALVLSAGAGNEGLVDHLFGPSAPAAYAEARQQTVKTFMLVIRHPDGSLPPVAGMFPDTGGVFLASRRDTSGRTVWLIGDKQRRLVSLPGEMTAFDAATWFRHLKVELERLLPSVFANSGDYEWGIYEATKAEPWTRKIEIEEGGAFPKGYRVHKHPGAPIWLTWPALLTFAPAAAEQIADEIESEVASAPSAAGWEAWEEFCTTPPPGQCRWKTTDLLRWDDFLRCFATP